MLLTFCLTFTCREKKLYNWTSTWQHLYCAGSLRWWLSECASGGVPKITTVVRSSRNETIDVGRSDLLALFPKEANRSMDAFEVLSCISPPSIYRQLHTPSSLQPILLRTWKCLYIANAILQVFFSLCNVNWICANISNMKNVNGFHPLFCPSSMANFLSDIQLHTPNVYDISIVEA